MIVKCGNNATISREQQAKAAEEMNELPSNSVIAEIIIPDYVRMRDENRACQKPAT